MVIYDLSYLEMILGAILRLMSDNFLHLVAMSVYTSRRIAIQRTSDGWYTRQIVFTKVLTIGKLFR